MPKPDATVPLSAYNNDVGSAIKLLKEWVEISATVTSNPKIASLRERSKDFVENV